MNKEYKRIERLISELKNSGKVKFTSAEFRYFSEAVEQKLLETIASVEFAASILAFYRQVDFIKLNWHPADGVALKYLDEDSDFVGGSLNIPSLAQVTNIIKKKQNQFVIDPSKTLTEDLYNSLSNFIPFDLLEGDGAICFKITDGKVNDELYWIAAGLDAFIKPLNITLNEYLDKGYQYRFFYYWQQAFFLNDNKLKESIEFYLTQFIKV